ncbi:transmembrane protein, putative (macronuclear) [Tetrahymena thermophila SB210]|uniref:Transmembrane protein, putative n=1 Tax=Tetrahymena thermophila (strain SB210) TaxID=312017 RepID=I7MEX4_TETTS|nr:transmembrane protein, putative [Tetrahymena thermophila SB210]EAR97978.1 transmembrane protein, putative [Tetrahymena thermophila SB210]|eukprot:XP_001018223.1 transmembrane protein, putative [Tetrahymena thermophila SB210]
MKQEPLKIIGSVALAITPVLYFLYRQEIYDATGKYLGVQSRKSPQDRKQNNNLDKSQAQNQEN